MYFIAAFGLLMIALSLVMIINPIAWARGILAFERKRYFHTIEVTSRMALGVMLLVFASQTSHPRLFEILGVSLVVIGLGPLFIGSRRHRQFAIKSASFVRVFRPAGFVSLVFGIYIVYAALSPLV